MQAKSFGPDGNPAGAVLVMQCMEHVRKLNRAVGAIEAALSDLGGRTCEDALDRITSAARAGLTVVADVRDDLEAEGVAADEYGFDGQRRGW